MVRLNDVFGISTSVPKHTYVDRSGLDKKFEYCLGSDRHIILHGGSKQGKTVIRRKNLPQEQSIVLQCNAQTTREELYTGILAQLEVSIPSSVETKTTASGEIGGETGVTFPLFGKITAHARASKGNETTSVGQMVGYGSNNLSFWQAALRRVDVEW